MSRRRFLVPDVDERARNVRLPEAEAHHLTRVLRLGVGDAVTVFDGRGREWGGRVAAAGRSAVTIDLDGPIAPVPEPPVRVTLAVGLLKGDQMDAVVRDATMLGAWAIVPMASAHVDVDKRGRRSDAVERWTRVAIASAKQCGRAVVPTIGAVTSFDELIGRRDAEQVLMCVEKDIGGRFAESVKRHSSSSALLLVGPEGGWSQDEVERAAAAGARFLHFGPRTLRAETAPIVALSALWTEWGW